MYSGKDFNDPKHKFIMMAKYDAKDNEFRIYSVNAYKHPKLFNFD
jgi:hypothetical protein